MPSDKIYPATEKKLSDLRKKGIVPYSRLAPRYLTLGCIILLGNFVLSDGRQIFEDISNVNQITYQNTSVELITATLYSRTTDFLMILSALILLLNLIIPWIGTRFLILPFAKHKEGVKRTKKSIPISSELTWGSIVSPISLLGISLLAVSQHNYALLKLSNLFNFGMNLFGISFTFIGLFLLVIESLRFRMSHKMNKEEIINESLEGQMSTANRNLISKASGDL